MSTDTTQKSDLTHEDDIPAFTLVAYLRDHLFALLIGACCIGGVGCMLLALGVAHAAIALVCGFIGGCAALVFCIDYARKRKFYQEFSSHLSQVDKVAHTQSLLTEPIFLEGRISYEAATLLARIANQEQESIELQTQKYRNYVELWIHEIKTPLAAIKLMLAHARNEQNTKIARECERIELQVEAALYYARSSAASPDYTIREVNVQKMCQEACKKNMHLLIERHVSLRFELDEALCVLTDEAWTTFIISQFVVNAAKYDATTLTFVAHEFDAGTPTGRTVLEIKDDGCGIPPADMPRIFERGFMGSVGRRFGSATGMGLYLVAQLCEMLGLDVAVGSEEGVGTRGIITFPHDRHRLMITKHIT